MRNVSVAGNSVDAPAFIGSDSAISAIPARLASDGNPPCPFEQSAGSRDRTPASGGVRFVPRRPTPSTGTGLGASASFSPRCRISRRQLISKPGNRVATYGPRLLQPARRHRTGKVNMATTERDILEGKVLPELQAIRSSM